MKQRVFARSLDLEHYSHIPIDRLPSASRAMHLIRYCDIETVVEVSDELPHPNRMPHKRGVFKSLVPGTLLIVPLAVAVPHTLIAQPIRCGGPLTFGEGTYRERVVPGANETLASDIDQRGDIVGVYRVNSDGGHGFRISRGAVFTFDMPDRATGR
jgi:hypothetical protein